MNAMMRCFTLLCFCLFMNTTATAGSREGEVNPQLNVEQLIDFAKLVEKTAAKQGARVFLLGRVGRASDEMPQGIEYTHTALAVYSMITTDEGKQVPGYAIYNLYQKNDALSQSELVIDYPVNFFAGAAELKAGIAIPTPAVQKRLLALIASGEYQALHNPNYSILANPFNSQFQNCTEFTLDLLNAAIYQTKNIAQLKANAKAYFKPQQLEMSGLKLQMAAIFMDDLTLADHQSKVKTATFSSIVRYLAENNLLLHHQTLYPAQTAASTL
ncbi:MAG: DUF2145 domain-containing protein [Psychrosphaera sp.]|nr:DUF2145 domain-containing protein [Psychrosphaera sp.]